MRSLLYLSLLILPLFMVSCTKNQSPTATASSTDTASIIGTWTWVSQSSTLWDTASINPLSTGISRTLIFDTAGQFTFLHNDSILVDSFYVQNLLQIAEPIVLLPNNQIETDTGYYQVSTGIVGCAFTDTTVLTLANTPYQLGLSTDTLLVHLDPCLSRVVDIYIRKN